MVYSEAKVDRLADDQENVQHVPHFGEEVRLHRLDEPREASLVRFLAIPDVSILQVLLVGVVGPAKGHNGTAEPENGVVHLIAHHIVPTLHLEVVKDEGGGKVGEVWHQTSLYDRLATPRKVLIEERSHDLVAKNLLAVLLLDTSDTFSEPTVFLIHEAQR